MPKGTRDDEWFNIRIIQESAILYLHSVNT
jgi:hypothetical protein